MKTIMLMAFASTFGFTACNPNSTSKTTAAGDTTTTQSSASTTVSSQSAAPTASFGGLLTAYLKIKNALASDDAGEAASGGNDFVQALGKVDPSSLTPDQKKTFQETADDAREMAEHIGKSAGKIEHQREHFEMLTSDMYDLAKVFKHHQTLYRDFCPMYNNGKGAEWISETRDIKNPYLGKKMPTCGEVKEEIK